MHLSDDRILWMATSNNPLEATANDFVSAMPQNCRLAKVVHRYSAASNQLTSKTACDVPRMMREAFLPDSRLALVTTVIAISDKHQGQGAFDGWGKWLVMDEAQQAVQGKDTLALSCVDSDALITDVGDPKQPRGGGRSQFDMDYQELCRTDLQGGIHSPARCFLAPAAWCRAVGEAWEVDWPEHLATMTCSAMPAATFHRH